MRLEARIKKIERQVAERGFSLAIFLKWFPEGKDGGIRQLLIERLPHTGPVSLTQFLDALPEDYGKAVRLELAKKLAIERERKGS